MKKTIILGLAGVMAVTSANAGWLSGLFGAKEAEPQTLEEACNKDEITQFCPEIILGTKTIQECLMDNVTKLSTKCAKFVKKNTTEKVEAVKEQVASVKAEVKAIKAEQKAESKAQKQALKDAKADIKNSWKETKAAAKAAADAEKAAIAEGLTAPTPAQ